jgi:hypothetical protein
MTMHTMTIHWTYLSNGIQIKGESHVSFRKELGVVMSGNYTLYSDRPFCAVFETTNGVEFLESKHQANFETPAPWNPDAPKHPTRYGPVTPTLDDLSEVLSKATGIPRPKAA